MKNKVQVHEFDPVIYPCRVWVAINPSFNDVVENFYALSTENERMDIDEKWYNRDGFQIATTGPAVSKSDGWIGLLVNIWKPKMMNTGVICHESVHCADFICGQFGITNGSFENGEAYAYLVQWIAVCIEKVKSGKI